MIPIIALLAATACFNLNAAETEAAEYREMLQFPQQQKCYELFKKLSADYYDQFSEFNRGRAEIIRNAEENKRYFQKVIQESYQKKSDTETAHQNISSEEYGELLVTHRELRKQMIEELSDYQKQFEPVLTAFFISAENIFFENNCPLPFTDKYKLHRKKP